MAFRYLGPDPIEEQLEKALEALAEGRAARELETLAIDFKEEPGRRTGQGAVLPGDAQNDQAAQLLADELACIANTPGAGAIVFGVSDRGVLIGTEIDSEWLRHRIYELTDRRLTVEVREGDLGGVRLLILRAPEAVEPIRRHGRVKWRVGDHCVEVDAATWAQGRLLRTGYDWSIQSSGHKVDDASPAALEAARKFLRQAANDAAAAELATASDSDLLRRLNVVDGNGHLTNAGSLLFVRTPAPGIDYIRRDFPGADSTNRLTTSGPLVTQIAEIETLAGASNRTLHLPTGLVQSQVKALPTRAVREVIVNGLLHRDWLSDSPTVVEHVGDTLTVISPGGFVGGVSPQNIITHPSTPRYRSLANAVSQLRLAEREGVGVDKVVAGMLALGHLPPEISEIPGPSVKVTLLGGMPDTDWIEFLSSCSPVTTARDVDMLLLLDLLLRQAWMEVAAASPVLQRPALETSAAIARLVEVDYQGKPVITQIAGAPLNEPPAWRLSDIARERLSSRVPRPMSPDRSALILNWAQARGRVSSTEAADLLGISLGYAGTLLSELERSGQLIPSRSARRGRGFHYLPAGE